MYTQTKEAGRKGGGRYTQTKGQGTQVRVDGVHRPVAHILRERSTLVKPRGTGHTREWGTQIMGTGHMGPGDGAYMLRGLGTQGDGAHGSRN